MIGRGKEGGTIFYSEGVCGVCIEATRECLVVGPRAIRELKFLMCSLQTKTCEDVVGRIWVAKKLGFGEVIVPKEIETFFILSNKMHKSNILLHPNFSTTSSEVEKLTCS